MKTVFSDTNFRVPENISNCSFSTGTSRTLETFSWKCFVVKKCTDLIWRNWHNQCVFSANCLRKMQKKKKRSPFGNIKIFKTSAIFWLNNTNLTYIVFLLCYWEGGQCAVHPGSRYYNAYNFMHGVSYKSAAYKMWKTYQHKAEKCEAKHCKHSEKTAKKTVKSK